MARRLLLPLSAVWLSGCLTTSIPPDAADREAAITIEDFSAWLGADALELHPERGELEKRKIAWSYELSYAYEGTAARGEDDPIRVVLRSEVAVHPNEQSARHNFGAYQLGLKSGIRRGGGAILAVSPTREWGGESDLFAIVREGRQIGNGFIGYRGNVATYVLITGLYSSDHALFEDTIAPKLRSLELYDPAAGPADHPSREAR